MRSNTTSFATPNHVELFVYHWTPDDMRAAKGVIHVAHGLAEHAARYARVAKALTDAGYIVYANDHRGHGKTAKTPGQLGYFAPEHGFDRVVDDLAGMIALWRRTHPELPIVFFGHSMGGMLGQHYLFRYGETIDAAVLSGTSGKPPALVHLLLSMAKFERWRIGGDKVSMLVHKLAFGDFNKPFKPGPTGFEWLSRDEVEVNKYAADPLCGFPCTTQLWLDLGEALFTAADPQNQARIPKDLPLYIFAGSRDPVSANLAGLRQLLEAYKAAGLTNVAHTFYEDGRHEMLNEINRDEVTRDLIAWLDATVARLDR